MLTRILGPTAAAPLLSLSLEKIARTPRPRLQVGYHVVPRLGRCIESPGACCAQCRPLPQNRPAEFVDFLALNWNHAQFQLQRRLGANLLIDRLLAGGIVGERLPLSNLICEANEREQPQTGMLIDVVA